MELLVERRPTELTGNTITDRETLAGELATVKRTDYAVDSQELFDGRRGVAAPLLSTDPEVMWTDQRQRAGGLVDRRAP